MNLGFQVGCTSITEKVCHVSETMMGDYLVCHTLFNRLMLFFSKGTCIFLLISCCGHFFNSS